MKSAPASPLPPIAVGRILWSRVILRHWKREPWLTAVLVGILSLGVAVFLSIRLANKAAVSGFGLFTESIAGQSDFILRPGAGRLPVDELWEIRSRLSQSSVEIFPVLEVSGAFADDPDGPLLRFVGADLVALQNTASSFQSSASTGETGSAEVTGERFGGSESLLGKADLVLVGEPFAARFNVREGSRIDILINDRMATVEIAGVLPANPNLPEVPDHLLLMDLPGLQTLAKENRVLSRAEFRIPEGTNYTENRRQVGEVMWDFASEKGYLLDTPEDRKSSVTQMSAAFRLNLTILSGLALLVGVYLILQAMEAAVIKRRSEIAVLRSLGVTPSQIRAAWLWEGVIFGILGAAIGILLGRVLAMGMVGAIARTVNTLYYETTTTSISLSIWEVLFCFAFGLGASLFAAWLPAREASQTPPAQSMRQGTRGGGIALLKRWPIGILLLSAGIGFCFFPPLTLRAETQVPLGGYLAAVSAVLGASILIGLLFRPVSSWMKAGGAGPMRRYAGSQLQRPGGRHRLTAAGLAVAIGMSAAMAILVASFENTLTAWIGQLLKADAYVAAAGANSVANENTLSPAVWKEIESSEGVAGVDRLRRYSVTVQGRDFFLGGADYNDDPERYLKLIWIDPPARQGPRVLEEKLDDSHPGWISESLARRFSIGKGSPIVLPTPVGDQPIKVVGVFAEYGNETGTLIVSRKFTKEWYGDDRVTNMAIYFESGVDAEEQVAQLSAKFPAVKVRTNARLREESIRIFHQTFAVTYALEAIAVLIAVTGLGLALAGLLLERSKELETLKSIGATRREVAAAAMWESSGIATIGFLGGIGLSFFLGWILIFVINPQSFGWTLSYRIPWVAFGVLGLLTVVTAGVVGWLVGYRKAEVRSDREE